MRSPYLTKARTVSADSVVTDPEPTEEQIRRRAYEIYLARGGNGGSAESDWRQAEMELRGRMALLGRP
jgi:hypothetical protein